MKQIPEANGSCVLGKKIIQQICLMIRLTLSKSGQRGKSLVTVWRLSTAIQGWLEPQFHRNQSCIG